MGTWMDKFMSLNVATHANSYFCGHIWYACMHTDRCKPHHAHATQASVQTTSIGLCKCMCVHTKYVCMCVCGDLSVLVGFCMSMHVCICTSVNALGLRSWNESVDYAYISRSICRLFVYGYMCMRSFAYLVLLSHPLSCLSDHAFASLLHFSAKIITMCMGMSRHTGPSPKPSTVRA